MELPLRLASPGDSVAINGRCTLRRQGCLRVVSVAGLPMHHWEAGDRLGEGYAIVNLLQGGYAQQTEIARAFGCLPSEMGRVMGLDRAPEVKTLRRKLSRLAQKGKAEEFGKRLARRRVAQRGAMVGFL